MVTPTVRGVTVAGRLFSFGSLWQSLGSGKTMILMDLLCHPVWAISTVLLALVVRLQRRAKWDPRACEVTLKGKTAIVTGANTGNKCNRNETTVVCCKHVPLFVGTVQFTKT